MLLAKTQGMDWTHGIDKDPWYKHGLMVLTTPMVLTLTHRINSLLLNHTRTRGQNLRECGIFFTSV